MSEKAEPPAAIPKPKRSLARRLGRGALYGVGGVFALTAIAVGYLHTPMGKAKVRSILLEDLNAQMNAGRTELDGLDYGLGADLRVRGLRIFDATGREAVSLRELRVSPAWGRLLGGHLEIAAVDVTGVRVRLVNDDKGGNNLKGLFKERPPKEEKPLHDRVTLSHLHLEDVGVAVEQPDGTKIAVDKLGLDAHASAIPADKTVDFELERLGLDLGVDKGEGKLKLGIKDFATGATVALVHGAGKVSLHPTSAKVSVTPPGQTERAFPIALEGVTLDVDEGQIKAHLASFAAGALALASIDATAPREGDKGRGADAVGLHLDAAKVNGFVGRELLASDVDVEAHVSGPNEAIEARVELKTRGGNVGLKAKVGLAAPEKPTFEAHLEADGIATDKLLVEGVLKGPPIEVRRVTVDVKGEGRSQKTARGTASVRVSGVRTQGLSVDELKVDARLADGKLTIETISVEAMGQKAAIDGEANLDARTFDVTLGLEGDASDALHALRDAGRPAKVDLPRGAVKLKKGDLTVHARGGAEGPILVDVKAPGLALLGARLGIDAHAKLERLDPPVDGKKVALKELGADVTLSGLRLSSIAELRGKHLPMDGVVAGHVHVRGSPEEPDARFDVSVRDVRAGLISLADLGADVTGHVTKSRATLAVSARRTATNGVPFFTVDAEIPLAISATSKGVDTGRPFTAKAQIPRHQFGDFLDLVPLPGVIRNKIPPGEVALTLDAHGTLANPEATLDLDLRAHALADKEQRLAIHGVTSGATHATADIDLRAWLDDAGPELLLAKVLATIDRKPGVAPSVAWSVDANVKPQKLASLPLPPERAAKLQQLGGEVLAHLGLHGTLDDAAGDLRVEAHDLHPNGGGPMQATFGLALGEANAKLDGNIDLAGSPLLTTNGTIGVAGRGLLKQIREKVALDPALDLAIDIPSRALASLAALRPPANASTLSPPSPLAGAPGKLAGHIDVKGTARAPVAHGEIGATGVEMLSGKEGGALVTLDATKQKAGVVVGIGATGDKRPLTIDAEANLGAAQDGKPLPIKASIRADGADLKDLVPKVALGGRPLAVNGKLDCHLEAELALAKTDEGNEIKDPHIEGSLEVKAPEFGLPGTKRTYRDLDLRLEAGDFGLKLATLHATESDLENAHRTIDVHGKVELDGLKPVHADLDLRADHWLLFGSKNLGAADAPRGTLTLDAHVAAELEEAIKRVRVDVKSIEVAIPDRFEKAHQPEDVHAGDLMFLGDPGVALGKLPTPPKKEEPKPVDQHGERERPLEPSAEEKGADIEIVVQRSRILQSPIEMDPHGTLTVRLRNGARTLRGKLEMSRGELSLGGKFHPLDKGSLTFDEAHPEGYLDLYFSREVPKASMREVSEASAGKAITIHMFGSIANRTTILGGAGSPGALYDLLAMHNAGRVRYTSGPDLPMSETVQFPELENVLVLSFMSVNLPHLLFLSRADVWASPYDGTQSYGRLEHVEMERFSPGDSVRVRAAQRPSEMGKSDDELEVDGVLFHSTRAFVGAGVTVGSRGGGGPAFVVEWSSKD